MYEVSILTELDNTSIKALSILDVISDFTIIKYSTIISNPELVLRVP